MMPFEGWAYTDGHRLYTITSTGFRPVRERDCLDAYRRLRGEPAPVRVVPPLLEADAREVEEMFG